MINPAEKYVVRIISSLDNVIPVRYQYLHDSLERREIIRVIKQNKKAKEYIISAGLPDKDIQLLKALIVVDFGKDSPIKREACKDGITIDGIKYVRYKRTSSAAKSGHCFFIADEPMNSKGKTLAGFMHEWSLCGFDDTAKYQNPVSWEAYTALTLSEIKGTVGLSVKSIYILPDIEVTENDREKVVRVYSYAGALRAENAAVQVKNKIWDGEGLLDESIFEDSDFKDKSMLLLRSHFFKSCVFRTKLQKWFEVNRITKIEQLSGKGFTLAEDIKDIKLV